MRPRDRRMSELVNTIAPIKTEPGGRVCAVVDDDSGMVTVFVVNRHPAAAVELSLDLRSVMPVCVETSLVLSDEDVHAVNTSSQPLRVRPAPLPDTRLNGTSLCTRLPPVSWAMIRLEMA